MRFALIEYTTDLNHRQERVTFTHDALKAHRWLDECRGLVCGSEANAQEAQYFHRWLREAYLLPPRWRRPSDRTMDRLRETLIGHVRRVGTPIVTTQNIDG